MSVTFPRAGRLLIELVLVGLVVSCTGELPNTAVAAEQAEPSNSGLSAATPIVALIRERDIKTPDESSPVPLLEQLRRELAKSDPSGAFAGIIYDLSAGNTLPKDWL